MNSKFNFKSFIIITDDICASLLVHPLGPLWVMPDIVFKVCTFGHHVGISVPSSGSHLVVGWSVDGFCTDHPRWYHQAYGIRFIDHALGDHDRYNTSIECHAMGRGTGTLS